MIQPFVSTNYFISNISINSYLVIDSENSKPYLKSLFMRMVLTRGEDILILNHPLNMV